MELNILDKRSNLDDAANAFIRAYIDEVSRIKKRGTRRQKIAYLITRMKNKTNIIYCIKKCIAL